MRKIIIIGGGAAGLIASATAAGRGEDVTVIEKNSRPARKVMITGKGRCNVTNACFDLDDLINSVVTNKRFMYSAFSSFMPYDTIALIEEMGVPTKIERGNRVFPESDKAVDIVDALVKNAKQNGVKFVEGTVTSFNTENNVIKSVNLADGTVVDGDAFAICTGGLSYQSTGSTGDGYRLAESVGHSITDIEPALISLVASNGFVPKLQDLSLRNISIKLLDGEKEIYSDFGEMLFTHYGVSGPVILSASSHMTHPKEHNYKIVIDLKPALDEQTLDKRIQRDFAENTNKDFINSLSKLLPNKLIPVIVKLSGIEPSEKVNQITKVQRKNLVSLLKNFTVNISDFRPINEAIITSGGVDVKEINPKTMGSKIVDNLYFAGEVIDVDAYTGGFNLQVAFSTGYLCGMNI
ncbi:NAD(P)/FAD-dependent oxidoreductase [Eubacterium coprostanoligenes]|uniref:NAD(P)/FAD-dependent oxidoreductase n=1 Tax=Eubacterium coprostanoligenes TaxID=290054 RepID=UPI0023545F16|nr:NAD(P)/FAD-dependent oxidoreductase [Eubacterium coprostanoligenes]MCI6254920.1 NAD(P)/FAD-dependent oxidoreductase [Eubacterium coprostanoligenes]MDY5400215.1 NAD(P)/FAD-dependent oxidoreductase [Eubacterium coprostanoligenes]